MITTKFNRMKFSSLNATTFSLTAIGYILYFLIRRGWDSEALFSITLGVFIVNVIMLVYSLILLREEQQNAPDLKKQRITVYLKLLANVGFTLLMLIYI